MITIRPASENDIPKIRSVAFRTWPIAYGNILSQEQLQYMLDRFYSESSLKQQINEWHHHFLLALDHEEICGFASYNRISDETDTFKLQKLYVLPDLHGKNIGKTLLNEVKQSAIENNISAIILNVNRYNNARVFYEKQGFYISHEEDKDIGQGYFMNDYIMKWDRPKESRQPGAESPAGDSAETQTQLN